ncbi:MAG: hypothetical protein IJ863_04435 [Spirochaetales bacterium]|nr:hypothetical protein [Spirochaetales bacterium]
MKKVLIGLLVVVMVMSLTSCSQELANLMGKMSNNVFGIPADTSAADAATATVDSSVTKDEGGNVTVDLSAAAAITSSISEIKDSPKKTEAFKSQLSETVVPADATPEEQQAVKDAIVSAATEAATALADAVGDSEIVAEIQNVLNGISASLSDNPTKAELATVAVIAEIATTAADVVKSGTDSLTEEDVNALVEKGLSAYDTLVVVTEISGIDVLGDVDISSLLSSISKDVSRDDSKFDIGVFKTSVSKLLKLVTTDKQFSATKYKALIFQAKAVKASLDSIAMFYVEQDPDAILAKQIECGLTVDDLGLYLVSSILVEADKLGGDSWTGFLAAFINENYDALESLGAVEFKDIDEGIFYNAMSAIDTNIDGSLSGTDKESILKELGEDMKNAIANKTSFQFTADALNILRTGAVILVDAEYTGLLEMGNGDGTITGLLSSF